MRFQVWESDAVPATRTVVSDCGRTMAFSSKKFTDSHIEYRTPQPPESVVRPAENGQPKARTTRRAGPLRARPPARLRSVKNALAVLRHQALRPDVGPVLLDVRQAVRAGGRLLHHGPAGRNRRELRPQGML